MKNLTPTKEKATAKENEENEDKQEPTKKDETVDKHTANKIVAKPKPKLLNKTAGKQDNKTPARLKGNISEPKQTPVTICKITFRRRNLPRRYHNPNR